MKVSCRVVVEYVKPGGLILPWLAQFVPRVGDDEPFPMNLSRYLWLISGRSQRQFEAEVLAHGKN